MEFQNRLYELRKRAGLSQEQLADLVGVTRQAVQKWEAGASRPDMENLTALARYFNVTLDWLITGAETAPVRQEQTVVVEKHYHYEGWRYEYKSKRTLFGLPLLHVKLAQRGMCMARGIVAVGNVSLGLVSVGCFSLGLLSVGVISLGLLVLGCMGIGLLACAGIAVGVIAVGGVAIGYVALGGSAVGTYAAGAAVQGSQVAVGMAAVAPVTLDLGSTGEALEQALAQAQTPGWVQALLLHFLGK